MYATEVTPPSAEKKKHTEENYFKAPKMNVCPSAQMRNGANRMNTASIKLFVTSKTFPMMPIQKTSNWTWKSLNFMTVEHNLMRWFLSLTRHIIWWLRINKSWEVAHLTLESSEPSVMESIFTINKQDYKISKCQKWS